MSLPPLQPDQLVKPSHFELRISLLFGAIFLPLGIHLPYFPLWLEANGFSAEQIGIVLAAPMFLRVVTTPIMTAMADRASDRANMLMTISAASVVLSLGYFLPPSYGIVLAVSVLLAIVWTPQSPLADSLALSGVRRFGSSYPRMRIWGSLMFLVGSFLGGLILTATGASAVPVMISAGLLGTMVAAFATPRLGRPRRASPLSAAALQEATPKLFNRYFLLFVLGVGIINSSHGFLFGFVSIYWKGIGISDSVIGLLWAWAVVAEVVIFMRLQPAVRLDNGNRGAGHSRRGGDRALDRLPADRAGRSWRAGLLRRAEPACAVHRHAADRVAEDDRRDGAGRAHRRGAGRGVLRDRLFDGRRHAGVGSALRAARNGRVLRHGGRGGGWAGLHRRRGGQPQSAGSGGETIEPR